MIRSILLWVAISIPVASQAIEIKTLGTTYSENFDTLASSGTSSTVPAGWSIVETGSNHDGTYTALAGNSNAGDTYSFGSSGSTERAFGGLRSGSLVPSIEVRLKNTAGATITKLSVSYVGEQWRLGAAGREDRLDFHYSYDYTVWEHVNALDFVAPVTTGSTGALNGNESANRTALSADILGLNWAAGTDSCLWFRWTDFNADGSDDGLAIDDFAITAYGNAPSSTVPESLPVGFGPAVLALLTIISHRTRRSAS